MSSPTTRVIALPIVVCAVEGMGMNLMGVNGLAQAAHFLLKMTRPMPTRIKKAPQISTPTDVCLTC